MNTKMEVPIIYVSSATNDVTLDGKLSDLPYAYEAASIAFPEIYSAVQAISSMVLVPTLFGNPDLPRTDADIANVRYYTLIESLYDIDRYVQISGTASSSQVSFDGEVFLNLEQIDNLVIPDPKLRGRRAENLYSAAGKGYVQVDHNSTQHAFIADFSIQNLLPPRNRQLAEGLLKAVLRHFHAFLNIPGVYPGLFFTELNKNDYLNASYHNEIRQLRLGTGLYFYASR